MGIKKVLIKNKCYNNYIQIENQIAPNFCSNTRNFD